MQARSPPSRRNAIKAALDAGLGPRAVRVLDWLGLLIVVLVNVVGQLQTRRVDAGWITSYGGDIVGPMMVWWGARRTLFATTRAAAEWSAASVLAGCCAWELCQGYDLSGTPLAITEGTMTRAPTRSGYSAANARTWNPPAEWPTSTYGGRASTFASNAASSSAIRVGVRGRGPWSDSPIPARS